MSEEDSTRGLKSRRNKQELEREDDKPTSIIEGQNSEDDKPTSIIEGQNSEHDSDKLPDVWL